MTAVATPVAGGLQIRRSADMLRLTRTDGRVTESVRVPVWSQARPDLPAEADELPQLAACREVTEAAAYRLVRELRLPSTVRLQSVSVTAGPLLRVLARLETPAGPVLVGGAGPEAVDDLLAQVDDRPELSARPSPTPEAGWDERPLVLQAPVAAALLVGVRWVLRGPAAARLDGRRVLPPFDLVDRPVEPAEGMPDDAGLAAEPWVLVRAGRVACLPRDAVTGLPTGRAVWSHDRQRLAESGSFAFAVTASAGLTDASGSPAPGSPAAGPPGAGVSAPGSLAAGSLAAGPSAPPEDAVHLVACVEGIRRYHTDGRMRLICLARKASGGSTFLLRLVGRPLTLLREVAALAGPSGTDGSDQLVVTPSLVLPSARTLKRSPDVRIAAL